MLQIEQLSLFDNQLLVGDVVYIVYAQKAVPVDITNIDDKYFYFKMKDNSTGYGSIHNLGKSTFKSKNQAAAKGYYS